ncbi:MAG: hypothetical protein M1376_03785 [Planctomycetes bacterium]|nr:hypothetical protein [Planctomycetota bacterium]
MCKSFAFLLGLLALTSTAVLGFSYDIRVAGDLDDVEEYVSDHRMYLDSSDLEMPYEDSIAASDEQVIGVRWAVPVPKGAQITKAYVEFQCDETKSGTLAVNLIIQGQLAPNAAAFTSATADVTSRPTTTAQVKWAVENWTASGQKSQTPDISAILQEIIDQPGWVGGNALVLTFSDDKSNPSKGIRGAVARQGSGPLLHIEVFNAAANTPSPADGTVGVFMPLLSWSKGDTGILHSVYLGKTPELTQADLVSPNLPVTMYYHVAGLEPGATYYWRVDEADVAGAVTTGPVWSFVAQDVKAYYPTPMNNAVDVSVAPTLTWQPGQGVIKHHLYIGASLDNVTAGAAATDKGELDATTFALTGLDSVTAYYWRVDELGAGGAVKTGPVWTFTTCLPVDDFESYTDDEGSRIYEIWVDGWTNNTGSTVGNTNAPFAERTIVHNGKQSMPMDYNNVKTPFYSEVYLELSPVQNWTANELANLILDFRGRATNGDGALYVVVEDSSNKSAVAVNENAAAVKATTWKEWKIPLSSLTGVNLAKVKRLYIGVGDRANPAAGGAGRLYIDDIRVTK